MPVGEMDKPGGQLLNDGPGVGRRVHTDTVALEGVDERFGHTVELQTDRGCARDQTDVSAEGADVTRGVAASVLA